MATNSDGHLVDSAGNVVVDFVWGNFPLQPNDDRATVLNYALDSHNIVEDGWNGYPLYTPNTKGTQSGGVDYITVPSVLGFLTAVAQDWLTDAEMTVTTAAPATNTATQPTDINVTSTTAATVTVAGGTSTWPVGTKVSIGAGSGIPAAVVGTWSVTGGSGSTLVIAGSGWTVADTGAITPGAVLTGVTGTIKTQSVAAGASGKVPGDAITITPWA